MDQEVQLLTDERKQKLKELRELAEPAVKKLVDKAIDSCSVKFVRMAYASPENYGDEELRKAGTLLASVYSEIELDLKDEFEEYFDKSNLDWGIVAGELLYLINYTIGYYRLCDNCHSTEWACKEE